MSKNGFRVLVYETLNRRKVHRFPSPCCCSQVGLWSTRYYIGVLGIWIRGNIMRSLVAISAWLILWTAVWVEFAWQSTTLSRRRKKETLACKRGKVIYNLKQVRVSKNIFRRHRARYVEKAGGRGATYSANNSSVKLARSCYPWFVAQKMSITVPCD